SGPETVVARLRTVVSAAGAPGETAVQLAYLDKRQEQLAYPQFQAEQWPIASAMMESATKLVVEERLKGAGMHWAPAKVNPMLMLRNAVCNQRWEELWEEIEEAQRREVRARRMLRQRQRRASAGREAGACAPATDEPRQRPGQEESAGGVTAVKLPGGEATE
ncbi:MAG: hypothetical protein ACJ8CR_18320, partial [Roseiflexaceae bacterium]